MLQENPRYGSGESCTGVATPLVGIRPEPERAGVQKGKPVHSPERRVIRMEELSTSRPTENGSVLRQRQAQIVPTESENLLKSNQTGVTPAQESSHLSAPNQPMLSDIPDRCSYIVRHYGERFFGFIVETVRAVGWSHANAFGGSVTSKLPLYRRDVGLPALRSARRHRRCGTGSTGYCSDQPPTSYVACDPPVG